MERNGLLLAMLLVASCKTAPSDAGAGGAAGQHRLLEVRGQEHYDQDRLLDAIPDEVASYRETGTKAAVDDAAWALQQFLLSRGFAFAEVDYEFSPGAEGAAHATLQVQEGPRTLVASIEIEGARGFDQELLRKSFRGPRGGRRDDDFYYVESEIRSSAASIARFYEEQGYLDVRVSQPEVSFSEDHREARVRVVVEEGVQYFLRDVQLPEGTAVERAVLEREVGEVIDRPFTRRMPHVLRARLLAAYGRYGRPDAQVEFDTQADKTSGDVMLVYRIDPGVEVTIGEIRIEGDHRTNLSFVRARMKLESGQVYDAEAERVSFLRLYRTGLFRKIEINLEGDGPVRDLVVELDELPSLEIWAEPGWGSYEQARLSVGVRERNIFGTGKALSFEATAAVLAQRAVFSLVDPSFYNSDYVMTYSLFGSRREEPSFINQKFGAGLELSRDWTELWSSAVGYQYRFTSSEDFAGVPLLDEDVDISSVTVAATRDSRNDFFAPRGGNLSRLSFEVGADALGSELNFVRMRYRQSTFLKLAEDTVLGLSARGGVIQPIGSTDQIPLQERFFNGGENTVRSFDQDQLGPKLNGEPVGGEGFTALTTEIRQRFFGNLHLGVFADAGNVVLDASDYLDFPDFRYALGVGLRYLLPIGPLRLDVAWNPNPGPGEDDYVLHFSIGMSF